MPSTQPMIAGRLVNRNRKGYRKLSRQVQAVGLVADIPTDSPNLSRALPRRYGNGLSGNSLLVPSRDISQSFTNYGLGTQLKMPLI